MSRRVRAAVTAAVVAAVVVAVEGYLYLRYAQSGAQFHFWLHALLGGAVGLALLTVLRLRRPRVEQPGRVAGAALTGHVYSAVPDVLFLAVGALHVAWMDVFALHITAHLLWPQPLLAALVLWALAVCGWAAARLGARRAAATCLAAAAVFLGLALALRTRLPTTLEQVREGGSNGSLGEQAAAWLCRVPVS